MNSDIPTDKDRISFSRRDVIGTGLGLAALGLSQSSGAAAHSAAKPVNAPSSPFESIRDYIAALDARGIHVSSQADAVRHGRGQRLRAPHAAQARRYDQLPLQVL